MVHHLEVIPKIAQVPVLKIEKASHYQSLDKNLAAGLFHFVSSKSLETGFEPGLETCSRVYVRVLLGSRVLPSKVFQRQCLVHRRRWYGAPRLDPVDA